MTWRFTSRLRSLLALSPCAALTATHQMDMPGYRGYRYSSTDRQVSFAGLAKIARLAQRFD